MPAPESPKSVPATPPAWVQDANVTIAKAHDFRVLLRSAFLFIASYTIDVLALGGTLRPTGVAALDFAFSLALISGMLTLAWYWVRQQRRARLPELYHGVPVADFLGSTGLLLFGGLFLGWMLPGLVRGEASLKGVGILVAIGAGCVVSGGLQLFQLGRRP